MRRSRRSAWFFRADRIAVGSIARVVRNALAGGRGLIPRSLVTVERGEMQVSNSGGNSFVGESSRRHSSLQTSNPD